MQNTTHSKNRLDEKPHRGFHQFARFQIGLETPHGKQVPRFEQEKIEGVGIAFVLRYDMVIAAICIPPDFEMLPVCRQVIFQQRKLIAPFFLQQIGYDYFLFPIACLQYPHDRHLISD